jgi:hypothetical protein
MHLHTRLSALALALSTPLLLAGCPSALYSGPADVPEYFGTVETDHYISQPIVIFEGGRTPKGVANAEAQCEDSSICAAKVVTGDRWPMLEVVGLGPGKTWVTLSYLHPVNDVVVTRRVSVDFVEPPELENLAVGQAVPVTDDVLFDMPGEPPTVSRCARVRSGGLRDEVVTGLEPVTVYSCMPARDMPGVGLRYRRCVGLCEAEEALGVCLETRGGIATALSTYWWDGEARKHRLVSSEGEHSAGTCGLK